MSQPRKRGNRFVDRAGRRYGRLLVCAEAGRSASGGVRWMCVCDCGGTCTVDGSNLTSGTSSCGCINRIHGMAKKVPEYRVWISMRERCHSPNSVRYRHYGGRGISICERWESFESFYLDMGPRPKNGTLDRADNNGNYEPGNCRWITNFEQQSNRSNNRWLEIDGKQQTLAQWVRESPVAKTTIARRLAQGWAPGNAVFTPSQRPR